MNGSSPASESLVPRLFSRFQAIYGNRVATMWADVDLDELRQVWDEELSRFAHVDVGNALRAMPAAYPDFPPTLPQFVGLCNDSRRTRAQEVGKLIAPRTPMPPHIKKQLDEFVAKVKRRP